MDLALRKDKEDRKSQGTEFSAGLPVSCIDRIAQTKYSALKN
ncbi:MAG: hypothetical protein PWP47_438 [Synergistaceae bacterium]|jgi:hypothetical protein|nr:hypothetical protein [Synergistaceae bacterium]